MATTKVNRNRSKVAVNRTTTTATVTDKCSLWLVVLTAVTIVLVVIVGVCVKLLLEPYVASVILVALIGIELLLGAIVLTVLACRRKRYEPGGTSGRANGQEYRRVTPNAPPQEETSWEYSNRTTLNA
ncbi:unnamed protein product [Phyllotreta striolata]|uniref:Uncharacterized protein n=1 Tax=Phyllotreta striolata TaxID=444603 RepID=A0A9N9TN94_PHYSR|nr:unnamed protein product [Phyllotreta striolata]